MTREILNPAGRIRIGTRGSPLALAQAHETRQRLMAAHGLAGDLLEIVVITTTGDRVQNRSLAELGGKGLFTKEIEEALLADRIDIAVHSMKDMPVAQPAGVTLDCFLPREDPRDGLVSSAHQTIAQLPGGAVVGTSSVRRRAQLLCRRPDLKIVDFRGNVQTRFAKLLDGRAQATLLAMAGIHRLGAIDIPASPIEPADMLPAVAQGAIGVERRTDDERMADLIAPINDQQTTAQLAAERAFLAALDGSCQTPIAGLAEISGGSLRLRGEILRRDGSEVLCDEMTGLVADGPQLGRAMAAKLLERAGPGFF